jgi:hypothetical protein
MMASTKSKRPRRYSPSSPPHQAGLRLINRQRIEIDRGLSWHVVFCRAQQERAAERDLTESGFKTYRPTQTFERLHRGKTSTIERAPVSRYLFVGLNPANPDYAELDRALWWGNQGILGLRWDATGSLLRTSDGPIKIGAGALQRFEDAVSGSGHSRLQYAVGQTVFVKDGPFSGIPFSIETLSDHRIRGLVDLLGGKVAVDLNVDQLEAA